MQPIPQKINEAKMVLIQMEALVQAMHKHESITLQHEVWFERLRSAWSQPQSRAAAAALLIDGPLNHPMDTGLTEAQSRRQTLSSALLEAAIYEEMEVANQQDSLPQDAAETTSEDGAGRALGLSSLPDPDKVQATLMDWLQLGAWRQREQSPLTEIGRMIERSSDTVEDAVATRLGLLVPFWSSLVLWRLNFLRAKVGPSPS